MQARRFMEHAKAERVVNELPRCRPTKKARLGTGERNEGIPRVIMDGRAESADAVGVQFARPVTRATGPLHLQAGRQRRVA